MRGGRAPCFCPPYERGESNFLKVVDSSTRALVNVPVLKGDPEQSWYADHGNTDEWFAWHHPIPIVLLSIHFLFYIVRHEVRNTRMAIFGLYHLCPPEWFWPNDVVTSHAYCWGAQKLVSAIIPGSQALSMLIEPWNIGYEAVLSAHVHDIIC